MANHVVITNKGIRTALKRYDFSEAIAEYIWNGFDAQANDVDLVYEANDLGGITSLKVIDNGYGIPQDELKNKFEPFFESEKSAEINRSILHGKNGVGRLTFFKFAGEATWNTIFKRHNKYFRYSIKINSDKLESYSGLTDPLREVVGVKAGTTVSFQSLFVLTQGIIEKEVLNFLKREFAWFLELNKSKKLRINGKNLDYSDIIGDVESLVFTHKKSDTNFEVVFIRWNESLNKEFSRYYYLDSNNKEKWKEYTTLNNKGDHFYHSVYIKTPYFDNFTFAEGGVKQKALIGGSKDDDQFKYLQEQLIFQRVFVRPTGASLFPSDFCVSNP